MPTDAPAPGEQRTNTVSMLGQAYSLLGFQIVEGVVGAGYPVKPKHSAVFAQIDPNGSRASDLARSAGMTSQAMGELIDELEGLGYVVRRPDPTDGRAKLVVLTELGLQTVRAGAAAAQNVEGRIVERIGEDGHRHLRDLLAALLSDEPSPP